MFWRRTWSMPRLFLRVGPVPWLQNLHSMTAIHPVWLNVDSLFGGFPGFGDWCRLRLLNDNLLLAWFICAKESRERARKRMLPVHARSPEAPRAPEGSTCTKGKVG